MTEKVYCNLKDFISKFRANSNAGGRFFFDHSEANFWMFTFPKAARKNSAKPVIWPMVGRK